MDFIKEVEEMISNYMTETGLINRQDIFLEVNHDVFTKLQDEMVIYTVNPPVYEFHGVRIISKDNFPKLAQIQKIESEVR